MISYVMIEDRTTQVSENDKTTLLLLISMFEHMNFHVDLNAYFARIGYCGSREPTLSALHAITAAHVQSIPFENLDVLLGRHIDLEIGAVFRKLVQDYRGGYCFEQNGLFLHVLGVLGFDVSPISARVRLQHPRDYVPPRTHMFVRV
jgi:N-hydroxyarylamine O-acetyltransferase